MGRPTFILPCRVTVDGRTRENSIDFERPWIHTYTRISRSRIELRVRKETSGENTIQRPSIVMRIGLGYIILLHFICIYIYFFDRTRINRDPPCRLVADTGSSGSRCLGFLRKLNRYFPFTRRYLIILSVVSINRYPTLLDRSELFTSRNVSHSKRIAGSSFIHSRLAVDSGCGMISVFLGSFLFFCPDYFLRVTGPWPWVTARCWISSPPLSQSMWKLEGFGGFCNVEWAGSRYSWAAVLLSEQHVACTNTFRAPLLPFVGGPF